MPTYFHTIEPGPGLKTLTDDACALLRFEKLQLAKGESHTGSVPRDREVLVVMLSGRARIDVDGTTFTVGGRSSVFEGSAHSVYLPRGATYTIEAGTPIEAALPSAPSNLDLEPYEILPSDVATGQWGTLNFARTFRKILVDGDARPAASLIVGETITPSGNWSTYPPHKHEEPNGAEVFHEEMYYFRTADPAGYGLVQHYSGERGYDNMYRVTNDTLLSMPHGYHTYVAAPGSASYYLWCLAGDGRAQGVTLDPELAWIQKTVGMF